MFSLILMSQCRDYFYFKSHYHIFEKEMLPSILQTFEKREPMASNKTFQYDNIMHYVLHPIDLNIKWVIFEIMTDIL